MVCSCRCNYMKLCIYRCMSGALCNSGMRIIFAVSVGYWTFRWFCAEYIRRTYRNIQLLCNSVCFNDMWRPLCHYLLHFIVATRGVQKVLFKYLIRSKLFECPHICIQHYIILQCLITLNTILYNLMSSWSAAERLCGGFRVYFQKMPPVPHVQLEPFHDSTKYVTYLFATY